jgi:TonB family protein
VTHAPLPRPPKRPLPRFGRRRSIPARREPRLTLPRAALLPSRWGRPGRARSLGPWALASLLLHALLLLPLVLELGSRGRPPEALPPPAFDIVFEGGGAERNQQEAAEGVEVPPAPPAPPLAAPPAPTPPQPPVAAVPPPPTPAPPVPQPPVAQPPIAQAPPLPPMAQPPVPPPPTAQPPMAQAPPLPPPPIPAPPPPPPRQVAEAPRPVSPPPLPPRPEAPPIAEAFPELPTAEQLLAPQTELRLPERFELPLPPRPTPQPAPPRQQAQRPPPQQQPQPRPLQQRPDVPGIWVPEGVQIGPQAAAPRPQAGRPQGRGLDTTVDPRFIEGRPSADPSVRVTGAQVGADWRAAFRRWLDQNIRYPERAIQLGEDGTVRVRVIANPDGTVRSVQLVGPSTSPSLNFGTTFPFQGARLPAFPPPVDPNGVTIDLTVNYILIRR